MTTLSYAPAGAERHGDHRRRERQVAWYDTPKPMAAMRLAVGDVLTWTSARASAWVVDQPPRPGTARGLRVAVVVRNVDSGHRQLLRFPSCELVTVAGVYR